MNWNPWKHFRLIGGVICIIAAFIHRVELTAIGLLVMAVGTVGAVDRLERLIVKKEKLEENDRVQ